MPIDEWKPLLPSPEQDLGEDHPINRMRFSVIPVGPDGDFVEAMICGFEIPESDDIDHTATLTVAEVNHIMNDVLRYGVEKRDIDRVGKLIRQRCLIQIACRTLYPLAVS